MQDSKVFDGYNISDAELRVGSKVLEGLSNESIGQQLGISVKTVKFHIVRLYKKTSVKSRAEFILKFAERSSLIQFEPRLAEIERRLVDCCERESALKTQINFMKLTSRGRAEILSACKLLIQNETNLTNQKVLQNFANSLIQNLFSNK